MTRRRTTIVEMLLLTLLWTASGAAVRAQDEESDKGWKHTAELSLVATSGNSESTTFALQYAIDREAEKSRFHIELSGLRAESDTGRRRAEGTPEDFVVIDETISELTAENYSVKGRYERDLSAKFFWFLGGSWERNEFAGFESRLVALAGGGNTWLDSEKARFKTTYALTATRQEDVVAAADAETFLGLRLAWDYMRRLTETTTYKNLLTLDQNLDDTDDLRADLEQSLAVAISDRLALKASLQLLFDNQPALESLPLLLPDGSVGSVLVELDELDSTFKTALVINF